MKRMFAGLLAALILSGLAATANIPPSGFLTASYTPTQTETARAQRAESTNLSTAGTISQAVQSEVARAQAAETAIANSLAAAAITLNPNGTLTVVGGGFSTTFNALTTSTIGIAQVAPTAAPASITVQAGVNQNVITVAAVTANPMVTGYTIERGTTSGGENTLISTAGSRTYTDTGLTNGTTYFYKAAAVNSLGTGPYSGEQSGTPFASLSAPAAPSSLTVTPGVTQNTIVVATVAASPAVSGYTIKRGTTSTSVNSILSTDGPATYLDSGLTAGTTYYYEAAAVNSVGTGAYSVVASGTPVAQTAAPATPTLTVSAGNGTISINATVATATPAVSGYTIERSTTSGGESSGTLITTSTLPYLDTTVTNGTTYYYKIAAVNSVGTGTYSMEQSATPSQPYNTATSLVTSYFPNATFSLDASLPASTAALSTGTAGIQVDGSNNVLAMNEPISGYAVSHGGGVAQLNTGGPGGFPYFVSAQFDNLVLPTAAATPLTSSSNESWTVALVMKKTATGGNDLFRMLQNSDFSGVNFTVDPANNSDAAFNINQNNGSAGGSETSTSATALNTWQVVVIQSNGTNYTIWRNGGAPTEVTATGSVGGYTASNIEFLNNINSDVSLIVGGPGALSNTHLTSFAQALGARYGVSVSTFTGGSSSDIAPIPVDPAANFLTAAVFPTSNSPPTISATTPAYNVALVGGATNILAMTFPGSGESTITIPNSQTLRNNIYVNYDEGDLDSLIGWPQDSGQGSNPPFYGVERTYAVGDPNDLIPVTSDGLKVKAHCSGAGYTNCTWGNIRSGFLRLPNAFKPGMTMQLVYRPPTGYNSWVPWWLYSGEQLTPYPGTSAYTPSGLYFNGPPNFEIDMNDNFPRHDYGGCPIGGQIDFGTPNNYGTQWSTAPHEVYAANGNGFAPDQSNVLGGGNSTANGYECETGFTPGSIRTLLFNWRGDGSNLLDMFDNGRLVVTEYMEYPQTTNGANGELGMTMLIGGQNVATFQDDINGTGANPTDNDGSGATSTNGDLGWTETIYSIKAWSGNVASPNNYK